MQTKVSENIATIAFDNHAKRKALITEMFVAFEQFKGKDVRAVVLRSGRSAVG